MCNASNNSLKHSELVTWRFSVKNCSEKFSNINSKTLKCRESGTREKCSEPC